MLMFPPIFCLLGACISTVAADNESNDVKLVYPLTSMSAAEIEAWGNQMIQGTVSYLKKEITFDEMINKPIKSANNVEPNGNYRIVDGIKYANNAIHVLSDKVRDYINNVTLIDDDISVKAINNETISLNGCINIEFLTNILIYEITKTTTICINKTYIFDDQLNLITTNTFSNNYIISLFKYIKQNLNNGVINSASKTTKINNFINTYINNDIFIASIICIVISCFIGVLIGFMFSKYCNKSKDITYYNIKTSDTDTTTDFNE